MAFYVDEVEIWKCPKHPSKRRRTGICPLCLCDRLLSLCPDCATVRPCTCCPSSSSSSSTSSSSFSRFFASGEVAGVGAVGRVSNLIDSEPAFRRSRSLAIPFFRSRSCRKEAAPAFSGNSKGGYLSIWSVFKRQKSKKGEVDCGTEIDLRRTAVMTRSRSVAVVSEASGRGGGEEAKSGKGKGWHFPSPIKVFRHSKISKTVIQERSPMCRG